MNFSKENIKIIEAIQMWRTVQFGICPAQTYPNGKEVSGIYVIKKL